MENEYRGWLLQWSNGHIGSLSWLFTAILLLYIFLVLILIALNAGREKIPITGGQKPLPAITLLAAFHNEAHRLPATRSAWEKTLAQAPDSHSLWIDDHSTDGGGGEGTLYSTATAGKKHALAFGAELAAGEYLLLTDADTSPDPGLLPLLQTLLSAQKPDMVILPIALSGNGFFARWQAMEFLSVMALTLGTLRTGKPAMCNGAGLCVRRARYLEFLQNRTDLHIASGDDMFLLEYARKHHWHIAGLFEKQAVISTPAAGSFAEFVRQRRRWAGKWPAYGSLGTKALAAMVWAFHLVYMAIVAALAMGMITWFLWAGVTAKMLTEAVLLFQTARRLGRPFHLTSFLVLQLTYSPYVVYIGASSLLKPTIWKQNT